MSVRGFFVSFFSKKNQDLGGAKGEMEFKMEFKPQLPHPGFAERSSKMYILPTLTYLEVGGPGAASKIIRS